MLSLLAPDTPAHDRALKLGFFALWLGVVLLMAWQHAFWRDEVRALSLALQGNDTIAMLAGLHGEGHPAVWYLLLRAAHAIAGSTAVLPVVSVGVAIAAALLLVLRSPFDWGMIALILLSYFMFFEYSVMARNYGISCLLLFGLAACYGRHRDHGVVLGVLLLLLANTNAHSVLLVGCFLLFWLVDIVGEHGVGWTPALRTFVLNAVVAALGVAFCLAMIYPPFNDAAVIDLPGGVTAKLLLRAVLLPAASFGALVSGAPWEAPAPESAWTWSTILMSAVLFGSLLGLARSPGAFIAGLFALIGFSLFFTVVYGGGYRHEALWLAFLISLYWIVWARSSDAGLRLPAVPPKELVGLATLVGAALLVVLLSLQVIKDGRALVDLARTDAPLSRAEDFAAFLARRPDLRDATIVADPDYLVETLPYYIANRTYLMREHRFGSVVKFTKIARLSLNLDDVLASAKSLHSADGKPVLILLAARLDAAQPARIYKEGYDWELGTTPEQVAAFLRSTRLLARFAPAAGDESFDVFVLDQS